MSTIDVNGYSLDYLEFGKGDPLVFIHGSASDQRTWQTQQKLFGRQFRSINYSRRYHWPNKGIPEKSDYAMMEHVDDLESLLQSLESAPAHLVGHSYGAFLALLLAIRKPKLARSLVLAEPPAITLFVSNIPKPHEFVKLLFTRPRTASAIMGFGAKGIAPATKAAKKGNMKAAIRYFGTAILGREYYNRLSKSRLDQVYANTFKAEFLGSGFAPLDSNQIRMLDIPTLLISARNSPSLFHRVIDRLEELLPQNERIEINGASHILHEDNASDYNKAVLEFLMRH